MTLNIKTILTSEFEKHKDILLLILFGSYASGRETPKSDIDLAIVKLGHFSIEDKLTLSSQICGVCSKETDIIDLEMAHGALLQEILTRGQIIICRDYAVYEKLINRMLGEKEDDSRIHARIVNERKKIWSRPI